jgi:hypothetical protein
LQPDHIRALPHAGDSQGSAKHLSFLSVAYASAVEKNEGVTGSTAICVDAILTTLPVAHTGTPGGPGFLVSGCDFAIFVDAEVLSHFWHTQHTLQRTEEKSCKVRNLFPFYSG